MCAPPFPNCFHRNFRRKESERQASFFLRVTFSTVFQAMAGSDIQTFDGLLSETLRRRYCRSGPGHLGQPFPSAVLCSRIFRNAAGQAAQRHARSAPIYEKRLAGHPRTHDVSIPLWYGYRHWAVLSSPLARISVLIWGGVSVFVGLLGISIVLLMSFSPTPPAPDWPPEGMQAVRWILLMVYGMPLLIGIWWLVLFNRQTVKSQFVGPTVAVAVDLPQKPACPLAISVLAWFYITSILNLLFLPFLPFRVPIFVFGRVLPGGVGLTVLILSCLAFFLAGIGLLKLKPWSYSLTLGLQLFWLASTVVTVLSPNYNSAMDSFM